MPTRWPDTLYDYDEKYEDKFENDYPKFTVLEYANGDKYEGLCDANKKRHGIGRYTNTDSEYY